MHELLSARDCKRDFCVQTTVRDCMLCVCVHVDDKRYDQLAKLRLNLLQYLVMRVFVLCNYLGISCEAIKPVIKCNQWHR